MGGGAVVVVDGGSSVGKSTLASALHRWMLDRRVPAILTGWDELVAGRFPDLEWFDATEGVGALDGDPFGTTRGALAELGFRYVREGADRARFDLGPAALAAEAGYRRMVAALAGGDVTVVVDEVCLTAEARDDWDEVLAGIDVVWIGLHCDPEVARAREAARGDRLPGLSTWSAECTRRHGRHDLELDSGRSSVDELLATVLDDLRSRWPARFA